MNRTAFSLPDHSEYRTRGGLAVTRNVEQFTGDAKRLDDLIDLLDRRRGVVLSSGTTVPGRYESFDLGFSDPPLWLQTTGSDFSLAGAECARRGADRLPRRRAARALRRHYRAERDPARGPYRARRSAGRRGPAHPPRQRDVAGARSRRRASAPMTIPCSACSAPLPTTSYSRSRTSCRSAPARPISATSCCMCRIACWPMTAPPGAAWC